MGVFDYKGFLTIINVTRTWTNSKKGYGVLTEC